VHGQFKQQTPMLQGLGNRQIFGSGQIQPVYAVPVLRLDMSGRRVQLNAGEAHGLQAGMQFALYPADANDFTRLESRLALIEVVQVDAVTSWANVVEPESQASIKEGAQAVLQAASVRMQRGVHLAISDSALRQQLETAIAHNGKGFVVVAAKGERVDFQVALSDNNEEFELWDAAGVPIPNLRPPIRSDDPNAAIHIAQRLVHLAKYRNVQDLEMPAAGVSPKLTVELVGAPSGSGEAPIFKPGHKITLRITNMQQPNPVDSNDPARILNITVLDLQPDWGITQIFPAGAGAFEPLNPGQTIPLEFETYLPEGYTESTDVVKVFATRATTQFRWLELPALDQPDTRPKAMRSLISDPLEQMLALITGDLAWNVAQVELQVKA
jgi:hypothetical protein